MRGGLPKMEPRILARWDRWTCGGATAALRRASAFVLHDGPPYANGDIHIGPALNKIHKDVVRSRRGAV